MTDTYKAGDRIQISLVLTGEQAKRLNKSWACGIEAFVLSPREILAHYPAENSFFPDRDLKSKIETLKLVQKVGLLSAYGEGYLDSLEKQLEENSKTKPTKPDTASAERHDLGDTYKDIMEKAREYLEQHDEKTTLTVKDLDRILNFLLRGD